MVCIVSTLQHCQHSQQSWLSAQQQAIQRQKTNTNMLPRSHANVNVKQSFRMTPESQQQQQQQQHRHRQQSGELCSTTTEVKDLDLVGFPSSELVAYCERLVRNSNANVLHISSYFHENI